jgi:hypothetical protein
MQWPFIVGSASDHWGLARRSETPCRRRPPYERLEPRRTGSRDACWARRRVDMETPGSWTPAFSVLLDGNPWLGGTNPRSRGAALQRPALVLTQTAPDTMILTCFQRPLQACVSDVASPADLLGLFNLEEGRAGVPDREEQLWILIQAGGPMAPIHGVLTPYCAIPGPGEPTPVNRANQGSSTLRRSTCPTLSSIDRQYKSSERWLPHISVELRQPPVRLRTRTYPAIPAVNHPSGRNSAS